MCGNTFDQVPLEKSEQKKMKQKENKSNFKQIVAQIQDRETIPNILIVEANRCDLYSIM